MPSLSPLSSLDILYALSFTLSTGMNLQRLLNSFAWLNLDKFRCDGKMWLKDLTAKYVWNTGQSISRTTKKNWGTGLCFNEAGSRQIALKIPLLLISAATMELRLCYWDRKKSITGQVGSVKKVEKKTMYSSWIVIWKKNFKILY